MADIDHLRDLYSRLGGPAEFVELQEEPRGTVRSDREVSREIEVLVGEMRERFGFRTTLSDADLVRVVRGFYDGRADDAIAADLDVSSDVVLRARLALQLFDASDVADVDIDAIARRREERASTATIADELGVSQAAVERAGRVLDAREVTRRTNYRYPNAFEELLADVADSVDRHIWNDRRALVDAHED